MKKIILLKLLLIYCCYVNAQYTVKWEKIWGDKDTRVYAIDKTGKKGLIIQATHELDVLQWIKTDSLGNILWTKERDNYVDFGGLYTYDIKTIKGEDSYVSNAHLFEGNGDLLVTKLDSLGNINWSSHLSDPSNANYASKIIPISNAGFLALTSSGEINSSSKSGLDLEIIKIDNNGNELWKKSYTPGIGNDYPTDLHILSDGSYLLGASGQYGILSSKPYLLKVKANGDSISSKFILVTDPYFTEWFSKVQPTPEENYVFGGGYDDTTSGIWRTGYFVKVDKNFDIIWKIFYPVAGKQVLIEDVKVLSDSTYLALVNVYGQKSHLLKVSKTGSIVSDYTITTPSCVRNIFVEMVLMGDSSLVLLGYCDDGTVFPTNYKPHLLKLGKVGNEYTYNYCKIPPVADFIWTFSGNAVHFQDQSISSLPNGEVAFYQWELGDGTTSEKQNPANVYFSSGTDSITVNVKLIITNNLGCKDTITKAVKVKPSDSYIERIYPNPFSQTATVSIKSSELSKGGNFIIYDVFGRKIIEYEIPRLTDNYYEFTINRYNLEGAMYLYKLTLGEDVRIGKLIVE